ncbi:MBL fold metallo-hydrolase [Vibrio genomosp. F6]|uniref:Zn-dependent hydrolase n=1 Tax=Vibrio genomosp. F6 str. FF-238 TaxID=1191298 RepID=A0A1E5CLI3_9VIBR|nr:MBL fold metallo-hydrolase [Vibrio genomosp. F6]OEE69547.1 Zn-dependent hydrolase [Vibrio genomosp. F6 str. FF-238]
MKLHRIQGYIQKIYLIEYENKLMLLDGASRADVSTIRTYIEETLQRSFNDLTIVVVTHMHPDHAGAAHQLRRLTGCKIVSAHKKTDWYSGVDGWLMHLTDLALAWWMANRMGIPKRNLWYSRKLKPDYKLNDGDLIPGFEDWQVLETPGHTDRDLSVYCASESILYVADLMVEVKKQLIAPFPIFHPNKYRDSLHRVYHLNVKTLLLAHGGKSELNQQRFEHLVTTAPTRPITHWRVTKIKIRALLRSVIKR